MSNVLERLAAWAAYAEGGALPTCSPVTGREAIAEIERLRGHIELLLESDGKAQAEIERLRGLGIEVELLSGLLRRIATELGRENEGLVQMVREALGD